MLTKWSGRKPRRNKIFGIGYFLDRVPVPLENPWRRRCWHLHLRYLSKISYWQVVISIFVSVAKSRVRWSSHISTLLLAGSKRLSLWRGRGGFRTPQCYLEKLPTDFDGVNDIWIAPTCAKFWAPKIKNLRLGGLGGKSSVFFIYL